MTLNHKLIERARTIDWFLLIGLFAFTFVVGWFAWMFG